MIFNDNEMCEIQAYNIVSGGNVKKNDNDDINEMIVMKKEKSG